MFKYFVFVNVLFSFLFGRNNVFSQEYKIATVAFYNLENLFDCEDDELTFDNDYTPLGKNNWTENRLDDKLEKLAYTISNIGKNKANQSPVLLGVAEVENRNVLDRLIDHPNLQHTDYGIAHFDSPDRRGIDVALLFDRRVFKFTNAQKHRLDLKTEFDEVVYTRDQLCVSGYLGKDLIYCIVNHWPSRRGGQKRSEPRRIQAAKLTKRVIDSINQITKNAKVIIMGDFNDNPNNKSFKKILNTKKVKTADSNWNYLYNPMESMYQKGLGSLGYRDQWSLFDQIILSKSLLDSTDWHLWSSHIYNSKYLKNGSGRYKGYPKRTFAGGKYQSGYSDHFPVYLFLIKKVSQ